jgi:deoxyribose-phosphate aldolase
LSAITHSGRDLARFIDHTLLKPDAALADFTRLCEEALEHEFYSVCVPPYAVTPCAKLLKRSSVKVCTVIGFPFGNSVGATKTFEANTAIDHGATELDIVLNISALKSGENGIVLDDIRSVVRAARGQIVKVILETCYLTNEEKKTACQLALQGGAQFVKTSTGFGPKGATEEDVALMYELVKGKMSVKASGGIRDYQTAQRMLALGATRLGTSNGVTIIRGETTALNAGY